MAPAEIRQWIEILRDIVIIGIGSFMLVYETAFKAVPNYLIVGGGLTLFGVPPALRLDKLRRGRAEESSDGGE